MSRTLPPKRFSDYHDPIYDSLRFHPWFRHLEGRREKVDLLKTAYGMTLDEVDQWSAAVIAGVDERELRDYAPWSMGIGDMLPNRQQAAFDWAYDRYCFKNADQGYAYYLGDAARFYGLKPRAIVEIWEVNPLAYPSNYLSSSK